jgi:hypothetical protein
VAALMRLQVLDAGIGKVRAAPLPWPTRAERRRLLSLLFISDLVDPAAGRELGGSCAGC